MRSRLYVALLLISVVIRLLATLAAWRLLELIYQLQQKRASTGKELVVGQHGELVEGVRPGRLLDRL